MGNVTFDLLIPGTLWLTLALVAAGLVAWYALRRPTVMSTRRWAFTIAMMSAGFVLVLGILLNPTWVREIQPPAGKPLLTILVDASGSMATPDVAASAAAGGTSRFAAAGDVARKVADDLSGQFDVRVRTFAGAVTSSDLQGLATLDPAGDSTDLSTALLATFDEQRPQGQAVLLLSDGIHNGPGGTGNVLHATRLARSAATPVYTKTLGGSAGGGWDLAVELRSAQDLAVINQKVPVTAHVAHRGLASAKADVVLLKDGKELSRRPTELVAGGRADVHFFVSAETAGVFGYEIHVDPLAGETTTANNTASYLLRVVDEPIRVLVLEGKPYWDSKFFMRTLSSDPAIALDSVVKLTDARFMRRTLSSGNKNDIETPSDPERPTGSAVGDATSADNRIETWKIVPDASEVLSDTEALKAYQVVVLGRDAEAFLTESALQSLQNWISRDGGSLVCYRGAPANQVNQRLARMLPVRWAPARESRFRVKLTDQGRDMNWLGVASYSAGMLTQMPALASSARIDQAKPLAVILATSTAGAEAESPAVVYQPYGSGRVVVIEGAGMWRWAFLPPQFKDHEQVYATLWPSLLRWLTSGANLMPGQQMMLRADKVRFATSEAATATLLARKEVGQADLPNIELTGDDGASKSFAPAAMGNEPGLFRVTFGKLPAGRYQVKIAGSPDDDASTRAAFDVRSYGEEQLNLEARPDLMARIASDSDGAVLVRGTGDEIKAQFREHFVRTRPAQVERSPAWDRWWLLAGVVGLWTISWAVRRSGGLV